MSGRIEEILEIRDAFLHAVRDTCKFASKSNVSYHIRGDFLYLAFGPKSGLERNKIDDVQVAVADGLERKVYCDPHETPGFVAIYRVQLLNKSFDRE
tara:strand:- start:938 stop:1228 length:291 start_codon:yes stop_codon:yes gene_type:complete